MSGAIERKFMRHFINTTPAGNTAEYEVIGKDLEEFNVELNPEVETKANILGETSVKISKYEPQGSVEPYYAEDGSPLFALLQGIVDGRKTLDETKTDAVEVHLWEEVTGAAGSYVAYRETCWLEVQSYGGDTTGYQIPFNVHYKGDRVKGKFNLATKTFTADAE